MADKSMRVAAVGRRFSRKKMSTVRAEAQGLYSGGVQPSTFGLHKAFLPARASNGGMQVLLLGTIDFVLVWIGAIVSLYLRIDAGAITHGHVLERNAGFFVHLSLLVVLFCPSQNLYE